MKYSPRSRITRALLEAFDIRKAAPGQIKFKQTTTADPHIQQVVAQVAAKTGQDAQQIMNQIQKHIADLEKMKDYSYLLYDTATKNAAESAAFDLIKHADIPNSVKFDPVTFIKLVNMIQLEHEQFFPLRAPGEINYIFSISPILVPSNKPEYTKFNQIDTAAATAKGEFIFNKDFMQQLMDWAVVEKLKPQGRKYESNGGPIPDAYAYIEFLIMHELLHYSYGDFSHGKRLKQYSPKEHNFASDYRSNYMLVKSGYDQLPIGLFSDHINYDRQQSYDQMVDLVHNEFKKLPQPLKDKFEELAGKLDDHQQSEQPGEPGESGGPGEPGEPDDGKPGAGDAGLDPDQIHKDIQDKLSKRQEIGSEQEAEQKQQQARSGTQPGQAGSPGRGGEQASLSSREDEIARIVPKYNWRSLIKQMVSSAVAHTDTTYAKPSRRAVTGMVIARQTGAGALKPGERVQEQPQNKLMLVFDTSGSMYESVPQVLAETQVLLKQMGKSNFPLGVCFFADQPKYFVVNTGENYYSSVATAQEIIEPINKAQRHKNYKQVFNLGSTGGTDFSTKMVADLTMLIDQGYNVMVFSDRDISVGSNWTNFAALWSTHKSHVFFVGDSDSTFKTVCDLLGVVPRTFSYLT